jgi:hypothetical protein
LSDRLKKAKTQRLIAAGVLSSEHALKPEPATTTSADDADFASFPPITIEVPPTGLHPVHERVSNLGDIADAGANERCPNCNGRAHLDMVDLVGHTNHYTCETCGAMWQARQPHNENVNR